jgi:GNAT superfamily N-acetyltransferase
VILVKRATANDGPANREVLARLLAAQLAEHDLPAEPERIARGLDVALAEGSPTWLLLAELDGKVAGVLLGNRGASVEKGGANFWIEELYVVPEARRRGVANALLKFVMDEAPAHGIVALELEVVRGHDDAAALYLVNGFKTVDRTRFTRELPGE